jgi:hypothetical protein
MTAKVTLSFADATIETARESARRAGVSLSAWMDKAAQDRAVREIFTAHADAVRRAGLDNEKEALADERDIEVVDAVLFGGARLAPR